MHGASERATRAALASLERGEPPAPVALSWLVHSYAATGRADIHGALAPALTAALDRAPLPSEHANQPEWLVLFVDASAVADDERIHAMAARLARDVVAGWPSRGPVDAAMHGVASCLAASSALPDTVDLRLPIDELERIVAACYEPGEGLAREIARRGDPGGLSDHLAAAGALLAAFDATARLPYPMLAEELMEFARRQWWEPGRGLFAAGYADQCQAARVFCRLAALHRDEEYRQAVVPGGAFDYAAAARTIVESLNAVAPPSPREAAQFAFAVDELIAYDRIQRIL